MQTEKKNRNIPRILITPIDSKKAFIRLAKPWKVRRNGRTKARRTSSTWRTLAWALFNRSFSLKRLCEELQTEHQKIDVREPTAKLLVKEIEITRQDGALRGDRMHSMR